MSYTPFWRGKYSVSLPTLTDGQTAPVALDVNSRARVVVDSSALPSGAATEGGNLATLAGTVTAGAVAVTGTFWQATQPVSVSTIPLPANAAKESGGNLDTIVGTISAGKVNVNAGTVPVTGTFWQATQPVSLASLPSLAAGTNLVGSSVSPSETSTVYNGTTALTPKFAIISVSSSGASQLVAAVSSKKIRVLRLSLIANAAVNVKFQSHAAPTDKTGLYYLAANAGWVESFCPVGLFETISGEALDINLSAAVGVGGCLTYVEV